MLYGVLGRAIGTLDTDKKWLTPLCAALFLAAVWVISRGTLHELRWRGDFGDTWYLYCGPAVFVCAVALLTLAKNWLNARPLPGIECIARHSLGIYGFHALIVHALRASHLELSRWPLLDIVWIFSAALLGSLLLSGLVQRVDSGGWSVNDLPPRAGPTHSSGPSSCTLRGSLTRVGSQASRTFFCTATAPNRLKKYASP